MATLVRHARFVTVTEILTVRPYALAVLTYSIFIIFSIFQYRADVACSGHGSCVDTARLFELFGLSYGNVTTDYIKTGGNNWDAYRWHHCLCSANAAAGFMADPLRPSVGPR